MSNRLRQNRGRYGFSLLCLLIILCLGCQPIKIGEPGGMADSSEPVKKSGEIAADEVWSGVVIAESDVIVPKGSALTIRSGTKMKFSRRSKLVVNGSPYAEGDVNRAIAMTSAELEPKPGDKTISVPLDMSLVGDIALNEDNRGLVLFAAGPTEGPQALSDVRSREINGAAAVLKLTVEE